MAIEEEPPVQPPHSRFHPVPTRPVFSQPIAVHSAGYDLPVDDAGVTRQFDEPRPTDPPVDSGQPELFSPESADPPAEMPVDPADSLDADDEPIDDDELIDDEYDAPEGASTWTPIKGNPLRTPSVPDAAGDEPGRFSAPDDRAEMPGPATPPAIISPANGSERATYHRQHSRLRR